MILISLLTSDLRKGPWSAEVIKILKLAFLTLILVKTRPQKVGYSAQMIIPLCHVTTALWKRTLL